MMKGLIENECGTQNPLMKLTSHFSNVSEQKLTQDAIRNLHHHHNQQNQLINSDQQLVNEYFNQSSTVPTPSSTNSNNIIRRLPAPRTFQMENLFNELKQIDKSAALAAVAAATAVATNTSNSNNVSTTSTTIAKSTNQSLEDLTVKANNNKINELTDQWSQEYWPSSNTSNTTTSLPLFQKQSNMPLIIDERSFKWSTDYLNESSIIVGNSPTKAANILLDDAWESLILKPSSATLNNTKLFLDNNHTSTNLLALDLSSSGVIGNSSNNQMLNEEMRKTANELLDSMQDNRFSETEFLQFVRNLSVNALNNNSQSMLKLKENGSLKESDQDFISFENEFLNELKNNEIGELKASSINEANAADEDLVSEWINEFQNMTNKSSDQIQNGNELLDDYWCELQNEWNSTAALNPNHPWLEDFQKVYDTYKSYEFDKENPLKSHPNPFDEGIERLKVHDIVNAVLLFEVAVQKEPNNMLAWQYLGTTQVKNEQDAQAIRALRKCLEIKADNLIALSTLATSYTNESMQRLAVESLIKWLKNHPVYSNLLKNDEQAVRLVNNFDTNNNDQTSIHMGTLGVVHVRDFIDLQEIFLKAVRESASTPNKIDPDLQCCLGVLFHLSGEYDKAADCFKTALQIKPNDYLLWNKLGATYANNNRNEEAIDAYYQALKLCPGFVRARYNLGIGCMNLGAYKEAIEHFLTALVQQSQASISPSDEINTNVSSTTSKTNYTNIQQMSETIWSTLRLALSYLNRSDLYEACLSKDLDRLKQEFKI